jgi:predicted RNase H-like HicB family nuclease
MFKQTSTHSKLSSRHDAKAQSKTRPLSDDPFFTVVIGQGDTYEDALNDIRSAIKFHIETFGSDELDTDPPILEAFIAEAGVAV